MGHREVRGGKLSADLLVTPRHDAMAPEAERKRASDRYPVPNAAIETMLAGSTFARVALGGIPSKKETPPPKRKRIEGSAFAMRFFLPMGEPYRTEARKSSHEGAFSRIAADQSREPNPKSAMPWTTFSRPRIRMVSLTGPSGKAS